MTQLKIGELITKPTTLASEGSGVITYVLSETLNTSLYNDITSNVNWDSIGRSLTNFKTCRDQISLLSTNIGFTNLSLANKKVASKYFVVAKNDRDSVHTVEEQKENANWLLTQIDLQQINYDYNFNSNLLYSANTISNSSIKENKLFPQNFKLTGRNLDPTDVDYDVYGLHKKRTITKGELVLTEYFKNYNPTGNTFSDLILFEQRLYTRNNLGLITNRTQTTSWLCEDGSTGTTKTTYKFYSSTEAIDEGISRRKNIIAEAKVYALSSIGQMTGFDLMTSVKPQIEFYIDGYKQPLIDAINLSTKPYMGTKQVVGVTATTIVNSAQTQVDSVTISGITLTYTSSTSPTKVEISSGLVGLITGSTNTNISTYVTAALNTDLESFKITSKIPGIGFNISASTNLTLATITANNRTIKDDMITILTF